MVHFKRTTVIFVAIEQIHCAVGVYFCGEDDSPEPARSTIRPQSDVSARDRASLPKQVLEILPLAVKGKISNEKVSATRILSPEYRGMVQLL